MAAVSGPDVGRVQENRLIGPASGLQQAPAVRHAFQVDINRGGARVLEEIGQGLVFGHIQLVAQAQELVEAQAFPGHPGQQMGGDPAALGDDGDVAQPGHGPHLGEGQGQTDLHVHAAQAVGSDHAYMVFLQEGSNLILQDQAGLAQFGKAGGLHHHPGDAQFAAVLQEARNKAGRGQDHHQVHRLRQVPQARVDGQIKGGRRAGVPPGKSCPGN